MEQVMATNLVYRYSSDKTRVWDLGADTASGVPVVSASKEPGVTLTATGNHVKSQVIGGLTISGIPAGGVGLDGNEATVATDGTWEFDVASAPTSTPNNTLVYITGAGALTLTVGSNSKYGVVDYPKDYVKVANVLPVKIGVFA
jgi:hypothetical protein